jgi:hypothetical protein
MQHATRYEDSGLFRLGDVVPFAPCDHTDTRGLTFAESFRTGSRGQRIKKVVRMCRCGDVRVVKVVAK